MLSYFKIGLIGLLVFSSNCISAQQNSTIRGKLFDLDSKPIPFGNLALKRLPDSSIVKLSISKENGSFEFNFIPSGRYYSEASMVGFRRFSSPEFEVKLGQDLNIGTFSMTPFDVELKEVVIESQRSFLTVEPDKLVLRVADNPLMINTNALDVLRKSPGVMIDQDEQIFLQGKSGLLIYIDGRLSPLSEKDLANWLRTIPSSQIESIEIITNPSAKYDAAGNAGIINIRLKKNQKLGMNGSINSGLSAGLANEHNYAKTNHSISLNRGGSAVNLFGNYGFDSNNGWNFMDIYRVQSDQIYDQKTNNYEKRFSQNFKAGADWRINKQHIISVMADGNLSDNKTNGSSLNNISAIGDQTPYRLLEANLIANKQNRTGNLNINHQWKDTSGRELATDGNYGIYQLGNTTNQPNFYHNIRPDASVIDRSFGLKTPVNIGMFTLKSDYEQRIKESNFGAGYKISNVLTENEFNYYNRINGANDLDPNQSSKFSYQERVIAGYLSFKQKINKNFSMQAGLRMENTHSEGNLTSEVAGKDSLVKRNYTNLFPSAGLTYQVNPSNSLSLSYSRRIDRPVYRFLNPFQYKLDELSYELGNPFLKPQYTDNFQVTHSFMSLVITSVGYSHTTQFFARVIDSSGTSSFMTRKNLADVKTFSVNLSSPLPIQKWWNGFFNFTYNHRLYEANFGPGRTLSLPIDFFNVYLQQSFSLPHKIGIQISGYYNSPNVWGGTFKNRKFWSMEAGLTKKVLNSKGVISLTVSDIFRSQRWGAKSDFGGILMNVNGGYDSRLVKVGFSYSFGKNEVKARQKKTGNTEEQQRLKGD